VVGDVGEVIAIQRALGDHVVLTAPKSSIGHLVRVAGAVEGIITLLSVVNRIIPPTLNLKQSPGDHLQPRPNQKLLRPARPSRPRKRSKCQQPRRPPPRPDVINVLPGV
jgi:3-oxoacyl-(acyl-carrier-protein) synthase